MHGFWVIIHLIGAVLGAGGAFTADALFFSALGDKKLSATEIRMLYVASAVVWLGIAISVVSGGALFFEDPEKYLASSKFLVKMTVVAVIIINGLVFHYRHMPLMAFTRQKDVRTIERFRTRSPLLFISGAVSVVSWLAALILGSLRSVPFSYAEGIGWYAAALIIASLFALWMRSRVMR